MSILTVSCVAENRKESENKILRKAIEEKFKMGTNLAEMMHRTSE